MVTRRQEALKRAHSNNAKVSENVNLHNVQPLRRDLSKKELQPVYFNNRGSSRADVEMRQESTGPSSKRRVSQGPKPAVQEQIPITLGATKLSEYTKIGVLGKGTYGEVHKCIHNPTGTIIAMKTFLFEVRSIII